MDITIEKGAADDTVRLHVTYKETGEGVVLELPANIMQMIFMSGMEVLSGSMLKAELAYDEADLEFIDALAFPGANGNVKAS